MNTILHKDEVFRPTSEPEVDVALASLRRVSLCNWQVLEQSKRYFLYYRCTEEDVSYSLIKFHDQPVHKGVTANVIIAFLYGAVSGINTNNQRKNNERIL